MCYVCVDCITSDRITTYDYVDCITSDWITQQMILPKSVVIFHKLFDDALSMEQFVLRNKLVFVVLWCVR
jgi:hypothetical protein